MVLRFSCYLLAILLLDPVSADPDSEADPLFRDDTVVEITIEAPWTTLIRKRSKKDKLPAVLSYMDQAGNTRRLDVTVHAHGNFRRDKHNCKFPPVTLGFDPSDTAGSLFQGQTSLRFVNHCRAGSERYEQLVLREYLAYRLFNPLTPYSYRARVFRIIYVDTEGKHDEPASYAFATEHESRMAERNDLEFLDIRRIAVEDLDGAYLNLTSVYQFFIGNTDFSPIAGADGEPCCHNYALYLTGNGRHLAIPYDFDMAGLVDAPYAFPNQRLKLKSVKQRLYRGRCPNNEHLSATLAAFRENRGSIYQLIGEVDAMTSKTREDVGQYVDEFYEIIDDPQRVQKELNDQCLP